MKNKKLILLVVTVLSLILFTGSARAIDFKMGNEYTKTYGDASDTGLKIKSRTIELWVHTFNGSGYSGNGYCLDSMFSGGRKTEYYQTKRLLKDGYTGSVRIYDEAEIGMLKYGYGYEELPETQGLSTKQKYMAAVVAHRAFSTGFYPYGVNPNNDTDKKYYGNMKGREVEMEDSMAFVNLGAKWAAEFAAQSKIVLEGSKLYSCSNYADENCYKNYLDNKYVWYDKNNTQNVVKDSESTAIYKAAKAIFKAGLDAAADYIQNGSKEATIVATINSDSQGATTNGDLTNEFIYGVLDIQNFDAEKGVVKNFYVDCPTCSSKGITAFLEYSLNGVYYSRTNGRDNTTNYLDYIEDLDGDNLKSGKIYYRVNITKNTTDEDCSNADFTIYYDYATGRKENSYKGAVLTAKDLNKGAQRFVVIAKEDGNDSEGDTVHTGTVTGVIKCTQSCDTEMVSPVCSTNPDESAGYIKTNEKIKTCIIDNVDDAGNSYKLSAYNYQNPGVNDENEYCSVFCKEDYGTSRQDAGLMLNPLIENVVCGRYFKLTSTVKGRKDCYTGSPNTTDESRNGKNSIDVEKYEKDILEAQQNVINAYNYYLTWQTAYDDSAQSDESTYFSYTPSSCCPCGEGETSCGCSECGCKQADSCTHYYVYGSTTGYSLNNGVLSKNVNLPYYYGVDGGSSGGCGGSCTPGSESTLKSNINSYYLQPAKNWLKNAIAYYEYLIGLYNQCTTGWVNIYQFDHDIKYTYNEYHGNEAYKPYMDLIERNGEYGYLEEDGGLKTDDYTITICTGKANDNYECQSGEKSVPRSADENGPSDKFLYNAGYGDVFKLTKYVECTETKEDGCKFVERQVSQASFVKKSHEKEQDYISPTLFYQTENNGRITINSGYAGSRVTVDAIKNGLPISDATTGGGLFKLQLERLGEFYSTGELGRLIDYDSVTEKSKEGSVAAVQKDSGKDTFDGNYVCMYESPCPDPNCPECKLTCNYETSTCELVPCPECNLTCSICLFSFNDLQLTPRTISTTNIMSAGRAIGYNWLTSVTNITKLQLLTRKASATLFGGVAGENGIENNNTTIYNDDTDKRGTSAGLAFSIKLTPEIVNYVKSYNSREEVVDYGGYVNDSLTCYDATDGSTYKNIYCYSDFIDELIDNYSSEIVVANRPRYRSNENNGANNYQTTQANGGYFELWSGYSSIASHNESCAINDFECIILGGPSWK